ncbi:MAG: polyphosphate kinase 2 family protein [Acidobacteria bacterium]|nr:polyphosphate kinase 2 family protein [Acidobacteriota bacterium]MCB9396263.1 polyphosphate kinase 2 family protein [Acidobacteriota bacterium]
MFEAPKSPYLVPFDGSFSLSKMKNHPPKAKSDKKKNKEQLEEYVEKLAELQSLLYAHDHHSVLLIFQAMDAAGKDGTIKAVLSGVNPVGCQIYSFKAPSAEELDHDFLWRTSKCLPERGRIGVFNRSYYEEVLVVRVHPEYLGGQKLPKYAISEDIWDQRLESIADHEKHLARNGTLILKFFLNVSEEEQRQRFLERLEKPEKNWKFSTGDVSERGHWSAYMEAYQQALAATSRSWAPWYCIPADHKPFMRETVAGIIVEALESLDLKYPVPSEDDKAHFADMQTQLEAQAPKVQTPSKKPKAKKGKK